MNKRQIELLSPARDIHCGVAAINHGADAVYIGGPGFGARAAVSNSFTDIEKLVNYAHTYSSRVYIALNTLLYDHEIEEAVSHIQRYYDMGVDAMIVQDMGLLESDLPPIPLHASTQCNNRDATKVKFLEDVGFEQVVLARELSLQEVRAIREKTDVALEFFVHGALCVSYSGQCYISEVMTGRSGNRGECAQFCRHKYGLEDSSGKLIADEYVLSLQDFNASRSLEKLIDAGIDSLKIEGRLKGESYVKNVTAHYRGLLDDIFTRRDDLSATSSGTCTFDFQADPAKSFNRAHTDYYLTKKRHKPGSTRTPKAIGEYVGNVVESSKKGIKISGTVQLHNGDGCCYFPENGDLVGFRVNRAEGAFLYPAKPVYPPKGTKIYRNIDVNFSKALEQSQLCRRLDVWCSLFYENGQLALRMEGEDGVSSTVVESVEYVVAQKLGIAESTAQRQLVKTGDTGVSVVSVTTDLPEDLYLAASTVNNLRRRGIESYLEMRRSSYLKREFVRPSTPVTWPHEKVSYLDNITNERAKLFYQNHGVSPLCFEKLDSEKTVLMQCKYCVRAQYGLCQKGRGDSQEPLFINDKTGRYKLSFDCARCEMSVTREKKK